MSERLNIKNMLVEPEPRPERNFDPGRDITNLDIGQISMEAYKASKYEQLNALANIRILGRSLKLGGHQEDIQRKSLKDAIINTDFELALATASWLKIVGINHNLSVEKIKYFYKENSTILRDSYELLDLEKTRAHLVVLGILKRKDENHFTNDELLATHLQDEGAAETASYWAALKIQGYQLDITEDDWQEMREELEKKRRASSYLEMGQLAADMAVLAADEIKIPEGGGLELIYERQKKGINDTPVLPNQRNF